MWEALRSPSTPVKKAQMPSKRNWKNLDIPVYILYSIDGYPNNVSHIVSDEGYGKNDYIKTTRPSLLL